MADEKYIVTFISAVELKEGFWLANSMTSNNSIQKPHELNINGLILYESYPTPMKSGSNPTQSEYLEWFGIGMSRRLTTRIVHVIDFDTFMSDTNIQSFINGYMDKCLEIFEDFTYSVIVQKMEHSKLEFDEALFNERVSLKCTRFAINDTYGVLDPSLSPFVDGAPEVTVRTQYQYVPISFDSLVTPAPKPELEFRKAYQELDAQQLLNMDQTRLVLCLPNPGDIDYIQKALQRSGEELSEEYNIFIFPESDVIEKLSNTLNPNSIYQTFFVFEYTNTTTDTINIEALKLYLTQISLHCTQPWYSIIINNNTSTHFNIKDFQTLLTTNEISLEHSTLFMIPNDMDMDERIQMLYSWFEMAPILILDTDQQRLKANPSDNRELTNDGVPLGRGNDDERIIDDDTVVKLSDLQSGSDSPEQIVHHTRNMNISIGIPTTTYSIAHSLYVDYRPTQTIVYCSHCSLCSSRLTTLQGLVPFILYSASIECVSSNQKRYEPTGFPLQVNGLGLKCLNKGCVQPDGIRLDDHLGSVEHLIISHLIDDNRVIQLHT